MPVFLDARIPVLFAADTQAEDVVLPPYAPATHPAGCACCLARPPGAEALDTLFLARVKGQIPWFRRVVVPQDDPALREAIVTDPVLAARYRLG